MRTPDRTNSTAPSAAESRAGYRSSSGRSLRPWTLRWALALGLCCIAALSGSGVAVAQDEGGEQDRIEALEAEVERLREEISAMKAEDDAAAREEGEGEAETDEELAELERRLDILAEEIERIVLGPTAPTADQSQYGYGPAASKIYRTEEGLSVGGYGEMVYQSFDGDKDDQIDFLRGIVYFGYKFSDRWLFNSEIEFEHASTGADGSASVEFAYLDYLWRPEVGVRTGLLLVPMGFVNELHEPTVFFGANRPRTESVIIPTTWRENGFGLFGELGPVTYRSYIVNGLEGAKFSAGGLRGGRQKGSKALAEDFAWVTRADWSPTTGLGLGASLYLGDSGQSLESVDGGSIGLGTAIYELHAEWRWQALRARALAAWAELDDVAELNRTLGLTGSSSVGEELEGYYVEVAYDILSGIGDGEAQLSPLVRWESVNTQAEVPAGFTADPANDREILTLGIDYKPLPQVVFKADWQDVENEAGSGADQFNLGVGYIF